MLFNSCDKFEYSAASAALMIDLFHSLDKFKLIRPRTTLHDDSFFILRQIWIEW